MRFSTVVTGLLFGLEAVALKQVPRSVPEIETAVCILDFLFPVATEESASWFLVHFTLTLPGNNTRFDENARRIVIT